MIDLDRGVTKRIHRLGVDVYMYKDEPGVFLNVFGEPVEVEFAEEAGFDTKYLLALKKRNETVASAIASAQRELDQSIAKLSAPGFQLEHRGYGWYDIVDDEGNVRNKQKLREDEALKAMKALGASLKQEAEAPKPEEEEDDGS